MWLSASTATPDTAAVVVEMMQVDVQEGRTGSLHAAHQRRLDVSDVVQPLAAVEVDDQVGAGATHAVAKHQVLVVAMHEAFGRGVPVDGLVDRTCRSAVSSPFALRRPVSLEPA